MLGHKALRITIFNLPADLLSSVAGHLSQDDIAALRGTCQSLRRAVDLTATDAVFHANMDAAELGRAIRRCTGLYAVKLQQLHPEASMATLEALAPLRHLRSLDLPMFEGMQLEDWTRLSGLTGLTLRGVRASHHGTLVAVLPRLTALRSLVLENHGEEQLRAAGLQQLAKLTRLTHLDLGDSDGMAAATLALAPQLPALQSLALRLTYPKAEVQPEQRELSVLGALTGLRQLFLEADIGDSRLRSLRLGANVMVSFRQSPDPALRRPRPDDPLPLQGLPHLMALEARHWVPRYRRCSLSASLGLPDDMRHLQPSVLGVPPPFDTLRELRMKMCTMTADDAVQLAAVAGRLRVLHLEMCAGPLAQVLASAAVVEEVLLHSACGNRGLLEALRPAAGTLKVLDIKSSMLHGDPEHLAALTQLTSLTLTSGYMTCNAIGAISQLPRLRELWLSCFPASPIFRFYDDDLAQLSALGSLTRLQIAGRHDLAVHGGWLHVLATARVPLRQLRLCEGTVCTGYHAELAIGQLTCLTSLHMSIDQDQPSCYNTELPLPQYPAYSPMQLHLLGCSAQADDASNATSDCAGDGSGGDGAGIIVAGRNTGLQELSLECVTQLCDEELAAAAAALPDLRRLKIRTATRFGKPLPGLRGPGLAAFSSCRRLRDVSLDSCAELQFRQLAAQLPAFGALASLHLRNCPRVDSGSVRRLQAAFWAQHKRTLQVVQE